MSSISLLSKRLLTSRRTRVSISLLLGLVSLCIAVVGLARAAQAPGYETPPVLNASTLLPQATCQGKLHRVDDRVRNDGYMNIYTIHSPLGEFRADSTAELLIRINEIYAIAAMDKVDTASEFGSSMLDSGKQTIKGAVNLVTDPLGTVGSALSGVGKMFVRAEEQIVESTPSQSEESRFANLIGYAKAKRDCAMLFHVDPYSSNQALQERLDRLAKANYLGGLTTTAIRAAVPGGVGLAMSAVGTTDFLNKVDVAVPPADMRRANREKLIRMGAGSDLAAMFFNNTVFTPVEQTILVNALDSMQRTENRMAFVSFVLYTNTPDTAFFRQRMAEMYADYHARVERIGRFVPVGQFIAAQTISGKFLLCFPLDYLVWTSPCASVASVLGQAASASSMRGKEMRVSGFVSPRTRQELKKAGFTLVELRQNLLPAR